MQSSQKSVKCDLFRTNPVLQTAIEFEKFINFLTFIYVLMYSVYHVETLKLPLYKKVIYE